MKKPALALSLVLAITALGNGVGLAEEHSESSETLIGTYEWNDYGSGELEAIFTPIEEGKWNVAFHFDFRDRARVFSGVAEGSLSEGSLKGEVLDESEERTFTFEGAFDEEGTFQGTHGETTPGRAGDTGTMSLASATKTLTGTYQWGEREAGDIQAIFTPSEDGTWNVAFHFDFRKRARVFSGSAEGSLTEGVLAGEVRDESEKRTFTFEGNFNEDGTFEATHAETTGGSPSPTGTMSLSR